MVKLVIFLFMLFITTSTFAVTFKPIGKTKYFPPVPYTNTAMNAGKLRGAVSVGNAFAIAKIKPSSVIGLGKQLAKANPYTLAAMLAIGYYQDDIGQWMSEPTEETYPIKPPRSEETDGITGVTNVGYNYLIGGGLSGLDVDGLCNNLYPEGDLIRNVSGSWVNITEDPTGDHEKYAATCKYDQWDNWGGPHYVSTLELAIFLATTATIITQSCPSDGFPYFQREEKSDNGELIGCSNPADVAATKPAVAPLDDVAPIFADDLLTQRQHQALEDLSNFDTWEPFVDPATGNVEPEYIESYNQPAVSPEFSDMLTSVASGSAQTSDANAPHYVPPELLSQTQSAVTAAMNDNPFIDPTTSQVVEPSQSTDGAATPAPTPDGSASAPFNITIDIPEDDTISQTEYEASNAGFFKQMTDASANSQTTVDTNIEEMKTQDSDFIDSLTPDVIDAGGIPDFPSIASLWQIGGGACIAYTSESSIAGSTRTITYDKHCPTYNSVVHPLLVWFLYVSTALYIIHLAGRTFKSTVS
ncbi:MAG: hypothetical protein HRT53_10450 [Colwellia sp.]|nr:hypothetical protein [Colwellia sp.]